MSKSYVTTTNINILIAIGIVILFYIAISSISGCSQSTESKEVNGPYKLTKDSKYYSNDIRGDILLKDVNI